MSLSTLPETDWPIVVISLPDAAARREMISRQLGALDLPFEFLDAIDGRAGLPEEYESSIDRIGTERHFGRAMTDGEYACALSHLAVYRLILARELPGAVVLEDDAILCDGFAQFLREGGYTCAPIIQLDHVHARVPRILGRSLKIESSTLRRLALNAQLTTGYSISRQAAAFILESAVPLRAPADWPCDLRPLGVFCAVPRLVDHPTGDEDMSTLGSERVQLHLKHKKQVKYGFRNGRKYLKSAYWKKKWLKMTTIRLS